MTRSGRKCRPALSAHQYDYGHQIPNNQDAQTDLGPRGHTLLDGLADGELFVRQLVRRHGHLHDAIDQIIMEIRNDKARVLLTYHDCRPDGDLRFELLRCLGIAKPQQVNSRSVWLHQIEPANQVPNIGRLHDAILRDDELRMVVAEAIVKQREHVVRTRETALRGDGSTSACGCAEWKR